MDRHRRNSRDHRPRLLLLSMYSLDRGLWGATARVTQIRDALARKVELDVISHDRAARAAQLIGYTFRGRLRGVAGVYVESSTALPGPVDLFFMLIARAAGIRVLTYVRDAYQLFPEYQLRSFKARVSRLFFRPVLRALMAASSLTAFPSRGLARAVLGEGRGDHAALLPPGARLADAPAVDPAARAVLFVGALRHAASGGALLMAAMEHARAVEPGLRLIAVSRPGEELPEPRPEWVDVRRAEGSEIDRLLPEVLVTVVPRPRTPYNDLAVPIKLLDYLGYGRPVIVTDNAETAAIVREARCGLVAPDTAEGLGSAIARVATADDSELATWGAAARQAAIANSWDARADRILALLGVAS